MRATGSHDVLFEGPYCRSVRRRSPGRRPGGQTRRRSAAAGTACWSAPSTTAWRWPPATGWSGYLHERVPRQPGASLATLPRFQAAVGEIEALLHTSDRLLIHGTAAELDDDPAPRSAPDQPARVPAAKLTATTNAIRAVELGLALIGNPGLSRANPLERHYRDVLCSRVHTSTGRLDPGHGRAGALRRRPRPGAAPRKETLMPVEIIGMIGTPPRVGDHPAARTDLRHAVHPRLRAGPRGGRLRPGPDRLLLQRAGRLPGRRARRGQHRAARLAAGPPPGLRRPDRGRPQAGDARPAHRGRLALHVISGGNDADQRKDGDYVGHDERYRRTDEYVDILRRIWTADGPIDHRGDFYRFEGRLRRDPRRSRRPHLPIYFGGASDAAVEVGARSTPTSTCCGASRWPTSRQRIDRVRAAAARYGRSPRFSVSVRPILGRDRGQAWERAHEILATRFAARQGPPPQAAERSARSGCWTRRPGARSTTAASGRRSRRRPAPGATRRRWSARPEQVAEALVDYYDIGATTLLIRGFDPLNDASEYGRELLPLVRAKVARREAASVEAAY